jgi:anti-anti-sigma factor
MKFDIKTKEPAVIFKLKERKLDASVSPELKAEFLVICKSQPKLLVIDLSDVEFCDSSGLSALLIADRKIKESGGGVKLVGLQKKVISMLKISQLDRSFQIFDSVSKALK